MKKAQEGTNWIERNCSLSSQDTQTSFISKENATYKRKRSLRKAPLQDTSNLEIKPKALKTKVIKSKSIKKFSTRLQAAGLPTAPREPVEALVGDIKTHLREIECQYLPSLGFINCQVDINAKMRGVLVDWLVEVHANFSFNGETLLLTVNILDRFLSKVQVGRHNLQMVGVAALLVACKYEEVSYPNLSVFVSITENSFTVEDLLMAEKKILAALEFDLSWASPLRFLECYASELNLPKHNVLVCQYLIETLLMESDASCLFPSLVAAAVVCISMRLSPHGAMMSKWFGHSEQDVKTCVNSICACLDKIKVSKLTGIRNKYRKLNISL